MLASQSKKELAMPRHQESKQEKDKKPTGVGARRDGASDGKPMAGGLCNGPTDPKNKR
jgi:hypothetical protein